MSGTRIMRRRTTVDAIGDVRGWVVRHPGFTLFVFVFAAVVENFRG